MAVGWSDNCYQYNKFQATTNAAITDCPHTTSMRAPGCMQSILAAEVIMEHVAKSVNKPHAEVQALNFYQMDKSPVTPFGDHLGQYGYNWTIPTLWSQLQEQAKYEERLSEINAHNKDNRWTKRGIAISPVKYVMNFTDYTSGALVNIYKDGTVLVSSGGSELGQGLNTKVALCVANELGAPLEKIRVGARETDKIANNSNTGGSGTSENSCAAAIVACQKMNNILDPHRKPGLAWDDLVAAASAGPVGLMAEGWWHEDNGKNAHAYATYGTAVGEVMLDVLTGEVRVEQVDILMDLGNQLDAAVDIGQLQGGFIIAMGHLLTEESRVDTTGTLLNLGSWDYKIPQAYDIPVKFNVSLLKDSPNPIGIKGSKASAEPAMCLIPCVYMAVKQAIYSAREDLGLGSDWFMLNTPLTVENIRSATAVPDTKLVIP